MPAPARVCDHVAQVVHEAGFVGCLQQRTEHPVGRPHAARVAHDQLDAERFGPCTQHFDRLGETGVGHEELRRADDVLEPAALDAVQHRHRFGGRGGFVEQRRRGHLHRGEIADHRLEVEQRFEAALRDLGLVRRVRRVPAGILEHVPEDHARRDAVVVAETDIRLVQLVPRGDRSQLAQELVLRHPVGQIERLVEPDARRHRFVDERLDRRRADRGQHLARFGIVGTDMARLKRAGLQVLAHD